MVRLFIVIAACVLAACAHAQTVHLAQNTLGSFQSGGNGGAGSGGGGGACPQPIDGGCAASPGGNFIQANFATHAQQSGQTWTSSHPWNWNSCGIDYNCGYYTATGSLLDPATTPITGCTYSATGGSAGGPLLQCTTGSNNLTIVGYNFGLHGCVPIDILPNQTGTITIKDNRFDDSTGTGCSSNSTRFSNSYLLLIENASSSAALDLESNYVNGNTDSALQQCFFIDSGGGVTVKYNVFLNCDSQPSVFGIAGAQSFLWEFNYAENFVFTSAAHGEEFSTFYTSGVGSYQISYDTVLQGNTVKVCGSTSLWAPSPLLLGGTISTMQLDHSVGIANVSSVAKPCNGGPNSVQTTSTGMETGGVNTTQVTLTSNYLDMEQVPPSDPQFPVAIWTFGGNTNSTNAITANGNNTLHFASITNGAGETMAAGMPIADLTTPSAIPANTTINSTTPTTVVMSANATAQVGSGDVITFADKCTNPTSFSGNVKLTDGTSINAWTVNNGIAC